ncbi:hypothetical protein CC1G_02028 [Coprinopsis cinerea okayama7|uniref:Integral membrane protein n=1 Tax=Coprinopsis cinerea (strain Okayama-7 / 130 / ATCC MYA-4618 / FGSC 9003) TaxID=240176 RepID=A8N6C3_COPC7|nr:hypothetical protein CC1G_02028 [Coprinopsis cinerea okayama7\|eukprot:XP_001830392.1 hypothetical protein CC1G_02028 [Coprinopsis cinerea okayama7\
MNGGDVPSLEEILLQERFDVARAVAFAVLACLSWEACINLSFDVDYFWASTRGIVKTIHYTARSFGVLSQIGSVYIKYYFKYLEKPTDSRCRKWLISQFLALILLMFNLEVLLMTRVYALYDRNYRVAWGLGIFTVLKSTAAAVIVAFTIMRAHFGQACILTWVPQELIVGLSAVEIATHCLIIGLTVVKSLRSAGGRPWWSISLLRMVIRDSILIFATLTILHVMLITDISGDGKFISMILPVSIGVCSISAKLQTCRIIRNMRDFSPGITLHSNTDYCTELTVVTTIP